jgi:LysM domain
MTAVTFHRPVSLPSQRRPALHLVLPPEAALSDRPSVQPSVQPSVHLTRRGRIVVLLALVAGGLLVMLTLTGLFGGSAVAGTTPTHPATRIIVVQPGQTLWSIAGQVAPHADRRDTIARIVELNAMPNSGVSAGARIAVPTH